MAPMPRRCWAGGRRVLRVGRAVLLELLIGHGGGRPRARGSMRPDLVTASLELAQDWPPAAWALRSPTPPGGARIQSTWTGRGRLGGARVYDPSNRVAPRATGEDPDPSGASPWTGLAA